MYIQQVTGINTKQRQNTVLESNHLAGTHERFNQRESSTPAAIANNISAISNEQVNNINVPNNATTPDHPPKITIANYQFVISNHANGLVYNYQVVSIGGSWSISLGSIVG